MLDGITTQKIVNLSQNVLGKQIKTSFFAEPVSVKITSFFRFDLIESSHRENISKMPLNLRKEFLIGKYIRTITLTTFVTISAALISLPFMIIAEFNTASLFNINSFMSLVYLGLFPTAIAFVLRFHLILKAGPIFLSYVRTKSRYFELIIS